MSPSPENVLKIIFKTVQSGVQLKRNLSFVFPVADPGICRRWVRTRSRSQPNSCVFGSVVTPQLDLE